MNLKDKKLLIKECSPGSPVIKNCAMAFVFGGGICALGQLMLSLFIWLSMDVDIAYGTLTVTVIFISAILTAGGVFDRLARRAGAGSLVPVCGFANAVVSQAMDAKSEGLILGVGAKIFTVAGPVILYGLASGVIWGIIYYAATWIF